MPDRPAILAEGLHKRFKRTHALDGFDLEVRPGTVCGLLGPNGAGKTTAVRVLTTLLKPDAGRAEVGGVDVLASPARARRHIGLAGQEPTVDEMLTGLENLVMWARLNHLERAAAHQRAAALLEEFGLGDAADKRVKHYSGGMRRRLDLASSLVLSPEVLFLDEPTTGLDPRNRTAGWAAIRHVVDQGTTVLLTTQYLDEADILADQIVVMDQGRVIAQGTPTELKDQVGGDHLEVVLRDPARTTEVAKLVAPLADGDVHADPVRAKLTIAVHDRASAVAATIRAIDDAGIEAADLAIRRPTLDDVFLTLTGRRTDETDGDDPGNGSDDDLAGRRAAGQEEAA